MKAMAPLTIEQRDQAKAICDEVCERLENAEDYRFDLSVTRGKPGSFTDEVWDEAMRMLRKVGFEAWRTAAVVSVKKR